MWKTVVSMPAKKSSRIMPICSSRESFSPSTSASVIAVSMSSRGFALRSSSAAPKYPKHSNIAFIPASVSGSPIILSAHARNCARSSRGTPTMSEIARTGTRSANAGTRSTSPVRSKASMNSSTLSSSASSKVAMRRGVNAWLTRLRRRVCCGGSISTMLGGAAETSDPRMIPPAFEYVS